jgi:hypothetical protein
LSEGVQFAVSYVTFERQSLPVVAGKHPKTPTKPHLASVLLKSMSTNLLHMAEKKNMLRKSTSGTPIAMKAHIINTESPADITYPKTTEGSKIAAQARKHANTWTPEKRHEMFNRGMQIVYGATGDCSTKVCR